MNRLLTIGRFAQLTGLTIRALRLYDEQGLLRPDGIVQKTGYRYYVEDQLERAELIRRLRQLDMPLDGIACFLAGPEADREQLLARHRVALRERIRATSKALHDLEQMTRGVTMSVESQTAVNTLAMVRKTLTDQPVLRRWVAFPQETEEMPLRRHFEEIHDTSLRQGLAQAGPPYCAPGQPDEDGTVLCEAGISVDRMGDSEDDIEAALLRGGEVASMVVYHPREVKVDGKAVVRSLWTQMASNGLVPDGDPRWIFHTRPDANDNVNSHTVAGSIGILESGCLSMRYGGRNHEQAHEPPRQACNDRRARPRVHRPPHAVHLSQRSEVDCVQEERGPGTRRPEAGPGGRATVASQPA